MKKLLTALIACIAAGALLIQLGVFVPWGIRPFFGGQEFEGGDVQRHSFETVGGVRFRSRAKDTHFELYQNGQWESVFLTGVNVGATSPGLFPGDLTVSYEEYYRWFEAIRAMNVNSIRVYTILRPQFYNALLDFNKQAESPLWLFQGVWMNEADIQSLGDVYAQNGKIAAEFIADSKSAVDIVHGNTTLPVRAGFASGEYSADVSPYLAGWILGIEWDPKLVISTNDNNPDKNHYEGAYAYTLGATPFEAFLCSVGDAVISYQTEKYKLQAPVGFTNWVTTDPLTHPNEPHEDEDLVTVNVENIQFRDMFHSGHFACYHVYPYYPDSMNYQKDYINYVDSEGKRNPYRAYLADLRLAHTLPILIGEFGIPASRGSAHTGIMGYNQGGVDETEQGAMVLDMFQSMYEENYAGGLVFMWQDEWFKRTWNNENFDVPDQRPFWSNVQTNEQFFGLLAFDPGKETVLCHVDGDTGDWENVSPLLTNAAGSLYMQSDERYVYFMAKTDGFDFDKDTLLIPLDTISGQGNFSLKDSGVSFDKAADFLISINGKGNSRIMVDSYYDVFYYLFGEQYAMLPAISDIRTKNSGRFHPIRMCLGYEMTIPPEGTVVPFSDFETGKLVFGNSDPASPDYRSLSDFFFKDGVLEIRIPWQLLSVMDPPDGQIMDDMYTMQNIVPVQTGAWHIGLGKMPGTGNAALSLDGSFSWKTWTLPTFHERLKPAYYELQEGLKQFR